MSGVLVLLPLMALIPAIIAKRRGLGFWTFYVFGLLLWIVAVPVALFSKDKRRRCRHCMEVVHARLGFKSMAQSACCLLGDKRSLGQKWPKDTNARTVGATYATFPTRFAGSRAASGSAPSRVF